METKTTIPGYLKKEDIAGDVPNLFTGQEVEEQNETEPTPEEMDQYDMVVARVGKMILTDPSREQIMQMMKGDNKDIPTAIGMAAAKLYFFAEKTAQSQGVEMSPSAVNAAFVQEIVPMLMDEGQVEGLWSFPPETVNKKTGESKPSKEWEETHQQASIIGSQMVGLQMEKEGRLPTEDAKQFLKSQGVPEEQMVPPGMTPVAAGVRKEVNRMQMEGRNGIR